MQRCFSSDEAELCWSCSWVGSIGLQTGRLSCVSLNSVLEEPCPTTSMPIPTHAQRMLDSQPYPCVWDRDTFTSRKWATMSKLWTLIKWDWALSPLAALHLKLFFVSNNLVTDFSAQNPFGACYPTKEVTQSVTQSAGFANCDLVQFIILVRE